ncbi:MAG: DNA repair exonuclease [Deltaproteobacteria bacterium]|nr:DNA repair exonuclease [Deltaproteobacteria bacterium]
MPAFSFVHAADLHLDTPFSAVRRNNEELGSALRRAAFDAFEGLIRLCLEKTVDFLLVAGDVFDGGERSIQAQVRFRAGLERLSEAGIRTLVVHGNHDPLSSWSSSLQWPPGVHVFGERLETVPVEREGRLLARVQGISHPKRDERRNLARLFRRENAAFHIGLLHANVGSDTGHEPYAPCSLGDLREAGMDYWALGHVHSRRILSPDSPAVVYPGTIQGRNIREAGEKGCYLVRVSESREIDLEFHPTDMIRWILREIRINGLETEQDLLETLERTCEEISLDGAGRPAIARIRLTGSGPLHRRLMRPEWVDELLEVLREAWMARDPFLWVERLERDTSPPADLETLARGEDFLGELLRYSRALRREPDFEERIRRELAPLFETPWSRNFLDPPDPGKLKELLRAAEGICFEELSGGEEID